MDLWQVILTVAPLIATSGIIQHFVTSFANKKRVALEIKGLVLNNETSSFDLYSKALRTAGTLQDKLEEADTRIQVLLDRLEQSDEQIRKYENLLIEKDLFITEQQQTIDALRERLHAENVRDGINSEQYDGHSLLGSPA